MSQNSAQRTPAGLKWAAFSVATPNPNRRHGLPAMPAPSHPVAVWTPATPRPCPAASSFVREEMFRNRGQALGHGQEGTAQPRVGALWAGQRRYFQAALLIFEPGEADGTATQNARPLPPTLGHGHLALRANRRRVGLHRGSNGTSHTPRVKRALGTRFALRPRLGAPLSVPNRNQARNPLALSGFRRVVALDNWRG